jgi:hypothetical protein
MDDRPAHLPSFLVIGAQKCATTSLHGYLAQHPGLCMSTNKEPQFLCCPGDGSLPSWTDMALYNSLEPDPAAYDQLFIDPDGRPTGESSTMYLCDPTVPARLLERSPHAKAIALLRDPGARAYSAWQMWRRASFEPLGFAEAIAAEGARRAEGAGPGRDYVENGRYMTHLTPWRDALGDDRILLLRTEELDHDPVGTLARIFRFLEVDPSVAKDIDLGRLAVGTYIPRNYNVAAYVRHGRVAKAARAVLPDGIRRSIGRRIKAANSAPSTQQPVDADLLDQVRAAVAEDTTALAALYGWDLAGWLPR